MCVRRVLMVSRMFERRGCWVIRLWGLGGLWLSRTAGDGGDEHDLVAVLEGVGFAAEEADVFVVDVDVNEAAELAVFAFDLRGEGRECLVDVGEQARKISRGGVELFAAVGVAGGVGGVGGLW